MAEAIAHATLRKHQFCLSISCIAQQSSSNRLAYTYLLKKKERVRRKKLSRKGIIVITRGDSHGQSSLDRSVQGTP